MVTEQKKLLHLKSLVTQKLIEHFIHVNDVHFPDDVRYDIERDIEVERAILHDINSRLQALDCGL